MSNKALKNFMIAFTVVFISAGLLFVLSNKEDNNKTKETEEVEQKPEIVEVGKDIYGNQIVDIDGVRSVFIE
jgi:preprotein translocase subunit SecG